MKFKVVLFEDSENGVGAEVLLATDEPKVLAALRSAISNIVQRSGGSSPRLLNVAARRAGAKGRQVMVVGVEEGFGSDLKAGDIFDSALELSSVLGYGYNAVSQELKKSKAKSEASAVLRGVEVSYADEAPGANRV